MRFSEVNRTVKDDNYGKWDLDDTRRPRLTLRHLQKMRQQREMSKAEHLEQVEQWKDMYARPTGE
jgi:hypothetical protein|tara:strand:+ start:91 stop:285 length:195 start_codon:yes stop_codon:yes gene_type:complete